MPRRPSRRYQVGPVGWGFMVTKKKAETSEEAQEAVAEEVESLARQAWDLREREPEVAALTQQVGDLARQLEALQERLRTHFRAHHKFEASVWQF